MNPQRNNSLEFKYEVDAKCTFRSPCLKSKIQISGWEKKKKTLLVLNIVKKLPINRFLDLHKYSNTTVCRRSEVQENICKTECMSPLKHCKEQNIFVAKKQNFMNTWQGHVNVLVKYLRYLLFDIFTFHVKSSVGI